MFFKKVKAANKRRRSSSVKKKHQQTKKNSPGLSTSEESRNWSTRIREIAAGLQPEEQWAEMSECDFGYAYLG